MQCKNCGNELAQKESKKIEIKIKKLSKDSDNFTYDNYGCESAHNGVYEVSYNRSRTEETLKEFAEWLLALTK